MTTVQLPGTAAYESQMSIHSSNLNTDICLSRELKKHLSEPTHTPGVRYHGEYIKLSSK